MFNSKEELIQYLKANHLYTDKSLGQNFLVDKEALSKIVDAGEIRPIDTVIEIGPGLGILTAELIKRAGRVVAIEIDAKMIELLNCSIAKLLGSQNNNLTIQPFGLAQGGQYNNEKVEIINADILQTNINDIVGTKPYKLIANIPYYITSKILEKFLTAEEKPELIVLLVQKEVAERICAAPGEMSVLSISVQAYGEPEIVGIVPASSFFPAPKVESSILKIANIKSQITKVSEKDFFRTVKIGFAARRKTLLNNLSAGFQVDKGTILNILKSVKLDENARAQELSIAEWERLAHSMKGILPR